MLVSLFQEVIASGLEFQYYAISEWTVEGTCMCNGHASICIPAVELGETINSEKVCVYSCRLLLCGNCELWLAMYLHGLCIVLAAYSDGWPLSQTTLGKCSGADVYMWHCTIGQSGPL